MTRIKLSQLRALATNPELFQVYYRDSLVEFHPDGNDIYDERYYSLYAIGHEFGVTDIYLVSCEQDAMDQWLDDQPTIPVDEIHEAYNAYDHLRAHLKNKGHEDTQQLRNFCNRYASVYFDIESQNHDVRYKAWDLDEAYQLQPNATGTGIVNVGHYQTLFEVDPEDLEFDFGFLEN